MPYDYTMEVTNRFKGLDMIDRGPEELWTEVHNVIQKASANTIPKKKKCKKIKWQSAEALQIAEKIREDKGKEEKERYIYRMQSFKGQQGEIRKPSSVNNAKKQNGKDQSSLQENWRYRDTKGTFHAKMGTIKDRNGMDLTEAECIKKRWQ